MSTREAVERAQEWLTGQDGGSYAVIAASLVSGLVERVEELEAENEALREQAYHVIRRDSPTGGKGVTIESWKERADRAEAEVKRSLMLLAGANDRWGRAEAEVARLREDVEQPSGANSERWGVVAIEDGHYLSTACNHSLHDRCRKVCKFCDQPCRCSCHLVFQS